MATVDVIHTGLYTRVAHEFFEAMMEPMRTAGSQWLWDQLSTVAVKRAADGEVLLCMNKASCYYNDARCDARFIWEKSATEFRAWFALKLKEYVHDAPFNLAGLPIDLKWDRKRKAPFNPMGGNARRVETSITLPEVWTVRECDICLVYDILRNVHHDKLAKLYGKKTLKKWIGIPRDPISAEIAAECDRKIAELKEQLSDKMDEIEDELDDQEEELEAEFDKKLDEARDKADKKRRETKKKYEGLIAECLEKFNLDD